MARRDEFDEDDSFFDGILKKRGDQGHPGSLRRVLAVTAGLAVLGILGAVMWSTMSSDSAPSSEAVPIIRADADAYKVAPSEPGGMAVPNKDSTIFETLKGQSTDQAKVENLFEDAEQPVRKEDVFTAKEESAPAAEPTAAAKEVASKMPKMPTVSYETPDDSALSEATPPVEVKPVETASSVPAIIQELKAKPKAEDAVAADKKAAAIQPAAGGNFYVQMAAVKSEADAKAQWPKYQAQYSSLSDLPLRVQKADLGAKGTYYRIQGGPVTEADARKLCATINGQKSGACVVAKR